MQLSPWLRSLCRLFQSAVSRPLPARPQPGFRPALESAAFARQTTFATGTPPLSAAVAALSGDALPDMAAATAGTSGASPGTTISVLLNTTAPGATTPSFAAQQTFAVGTRPFFVA